MTAASPPEGVITDKGKGKSKKVENPSADGGGGA
jgi:hypothetical protein